MGAHLARRYLGGADVEPDPLRMPSFDPGLGFAERKERGEPGVRPRPPGIGVILSAEEKKAAYQIPPHSTN
uniref:Uncharacterized protein n=1 Tax=Gopherus evgoodei TaxID=1825980 RepID=A0A8C5F2D6_9SAUR